MATVGIVGARGYAGSELIRLLVGHPDVTLVFAGSRQSAGTEVGHGTDLLFESIDAESMADRPVDVVFLALPDGASAEYVARAPDDTVVVDISADHRLHTDWAYGLPELYRDKITGARRIANPGCYATALQLAVAPLLPILGGTPAVFGVSGYSGAGTTPGPRNDPERLADNLMPYKLVNHNHERESSHHLGHPMRFFPHVHQAFRGLLTTAHIPLANPINPTRLRELYETAYADDALIEIQDEIPDLSDGTGRTGVLLGGFELSDDGRNAVVVAAEDNLLKGAAVQAIQNMNLALGVPELRGILSAE